MYNRYMANSPKTAYEIALNRLETNNIVVSQYRLELDKEEARNKLEDENRLDYIPEFVKDWKSPDEESETEEYSNSFVERYKSPDVAGQFDREEIMKPKTEEKKQIVYESGHELHWYGNFTSYTGFSKMNRYMAFGLSNRNISVKIDMQACPIDVNEATLKQLNEMEKAEISPKAPKVYGATVPLQMMHQGRKILYTMMENSETLHPDYIGKLNGFNEIWVPTEYNKEMFKNNGIYPPVYVMPLGVDTSRYTPDATPLDFTDLDDNFVFISVFKWNYRKGYDILIRSFLEEFSCEEPVSLVIISKTDVIHRPEVIKADFNSVRSAVLKEDNELPHVCLYDENIREKDMPGIYKRANAFVLISRGEGFGLPYCEAAACGLPIIGSYCSGQTDYLNDDNSFLVYPEEYAKAEVNGNMSKLAKHCRFYEDQIFPVFGNDSVNRTKELMRYVYENYGSAVAKGRQLTKLIHSDFSIEKSVDNVYNRLLEIYQEAK